MKFETLRSKDRHAITSLLANPLSSIMEVSFTYAGLLDYVWDHEFAPIFMDGKDMDHLTSKNPWAVEKVSSLLAKLNTPSGYTSMDIFSFEDGFSTILTLTHLGDTGPTATAKMAVRIKSMLLPFAVQATIL